jgi:hypothetical protein
MEWSLIGSTLARHRTVAQTAPLQVCVDQPRRAGPEAAIRPEQGVDFRPRELEALLAQDDQRPAPIVEKPAAKFFIGQQPADDQLHVFL